MKLHGHIDCTNEQYHSWEGISKSKLDAIAISPLNYWDAYINPEREPQEYKHCFAVGDGTHKLVLEDGEFDKYYAVGFDKSQYPDALDTVADMKAELAKLMLMTGGTKPELAERLISEAGYPRKKIMMYLQQDHEATMAGKIAIPAKDYKDMVSMLRAIQQHHTAGHLIKNAFVEQSYFVTDEDNILRKCRLDAISECGTVCIDLKTTDDVSEVGFGYTIANRRYHVQAAWYLDILAMLYGDNAPKTWALIAAQKKRPYDVAVHVLSDEQIEIGRALYKQDLERLKECTATNKWYGSDGGNIINAKLPQRAMR